jgi:hypothetical protein
VTKSYYRAVTDEDLFALAAAADVRTALLRCNLAIIPTLGAAVEVARSVFTTEVSMAQDGSWVFQLGAWRDHPDYEYAGYEQVLPSLQPKPVDGIAPDSSHFFRMPLWLVSFKCAEPGTAADKATFQRLIDGLAIQWTRSVLELPTSAFPALRMKNFMDGHNGVYRYGYVTQGQGKGFGPYELSGGLNLGWWAFLGTSAAPAYGMQLRALPFGDHVVDLYVGPNTTRDRHPAFKEPGFYRGPLIREILSAASKLGNSATFCR